MSKNHKATRPSGAILAGEVFQHYLGPMERNNKSLTINKTPQTTIASPVSRRAGYCFVKLQYFVQFYSTTTLFTC